MSKVAVGVEAYTAPDGTVTPLAITWHDGRRWEVAVEVAEKMGRAGSFGVQSWRWRVKILPSGQRKWLYFEYVHETDAPRYYVEVNINVAADNALRRAQQQAKRDPHDGYIQRPWIRDEPEDPDPDAWGWEPEGWC